MPETVEDEVDEPKGGNLGQIPPETAQDEHTKPEFESQDGSAEKPNQFQAQQESTPSVSQNEDQESEYAKLKELVVKLTAENKQ